MTAEERSQKLRDFMSSLSKEERTELLIEARILDENGHLHERLQEKKESKAIMNVFEIRNAVIEILGKNAEEFSGWEINFSLDTFDFDSEEDEYMDNYLRYHLSNHEVETSYFFHHQIDKKGEHHCWWYNFDIIFDTTSDQTAIDEMVKFIKNLTRRKI